MPRLEIETMQTVLKTYVQLSGETYQTLGDKLGLSIATAKRMLNGTDLSMERALEICDALGISFSAFVADVAAASIRYRYYNDQQEQYLVKRFFHFAFLRFLQKGWTTAQVQAGFSLSDADVLAYLADLEREGFVVRTAAGDLRLVTKDGMDWQPNGKLWQSFMQGWVQSVVASFAQQSFAEDRAFIDITQRTLSPEAFRQLQRELDELSRKYKAISAAESRTKPHGKVYKTFHSLMMLSEWSEDFWRVGPYR